MFCRIFRIFGLIENFKDSKNSKKTLKDTCLPGAFNFKNF